ncbi:MAG TPA: F0F1 ATP synthase subunit delta [Burkholderiales bacterium]|nr:F0F1 ATP synthase subunit delta [Burkholderiales bacterium]
MAEIIGIARPYAKALFDLAVAQNELGKWADWLAEMAAIAAHADMRKVIASPRMTDKTLAQLFLSVVRSPLDENAKNFVRVLIKNDRLGLLPQIRTMFDELKRAHEGVADAQILSAFPMSDTDLNEFAGALQKHFKRKVKPTLHIDKELIGGVKVIVGDKVLDSSMRAQLQSMAIALQSQA